MNILMDAMMNSLPSNYTLYLHNYAIGVMILKDEDTGKAFRITIRPDYI